MFYPLFESQKPFFQGGFSRKWFKSSFWSSASYSGACDEMQGFVCTDILASNAFYMPFKCGTLENNILTGTMSPENHATLHKQTARISIEMFCI